MVAKLVHLLADMMVVEMAAMKVAMKVDLMVD